MINCYNGYIVFHHAAKAICIKSRNVFFSILKLNYKPITEYVCDLPKISVFLLICLNLNNKIKLLLNIKKDSSTSGVDINKKISELSENISDDVLFIQDIYSIKVEKISFILTNCLFSITLHYLFNCVLTHANPYMAFYVLGIFLRNIREESVKNVIAFMLYSENLSVKMNEFVANMEYKENIGLLELNKYLFSSSFPSDLTFQDYITLTYSKRLISSIKNIKDTTETYAELKDISSCLQSQFFDQKTDEKAMILLTKAINKEQNLKQKMNLYHSFVSRITGINVGCVLDKAEECFLNNLRENLEWVLGRGEEGAIHKISGSGIFGGDRD